MAGGFGGFAPASAFCALLLLCAPSARAAPSGGGDLALADGVMGRVNAARRDCEAGKADICARLGEIYSRSGLPSDKAEGRVLLLKACDGNVFEACEAVAIQIERAAPGPEDGAGVIAAVKACEAGLSMGCILAEEAYRDGRGVMKDPTKRFHTDLPLRRAQARAKAARAACDSGDFQACYVLNDGERGGEPDLLGRACDGGVAEACLHLSRTSGNTPLLAPLKRACELKNLRACRALTELYFGGSGVPQDKVLALTFLSKPCEAGDVDFCDGLANFLHNDPSERARTYQLYRKACAGGVKQSCVRLGWAKIRGLGVTPDIKGGRLIVDRYCSEGMAEACGTMSASYDAAGPEAGFREAYQKKACRLGDLTECQSWFR